MARGSPPESRAPRGRATLAAAALGALGLLAVYVFASFALPAGANVLRFSSGIFDMDVSRVVADFATGRPAYRQSVHPLQKLLVAPLGQALDAWLFGGRNPLGAARLLIGLCMTFQSFAAGVLAWQLAGRSLSAAVAAACVCAFSFSTWLAASIPESAAVASLATVLPLLLLGARWGRSFTHWEAVCWGLLAVLGVGLTVTQLVHSVIALGVRATFARERPDVGAEAGTPAGGSAIWPRLALVLALFAVLLWGGLRLQSELYPRAASADAEHPLAVELHFLRTGRLGAAPASHVGRLIGHFLVFDFVAPFPGHSDFLIRDYGADYWSLSVEEAGPAQWVPAQMALAGAVLLAVLAACYGLRRAGATFLAPALCVASQLALHVFYGREYVLYSPHWHAVLVAVLVAAAWNRFPRRRRAMLAAAAALSAAMLANDVVVMRTVYREVEAGLGLRGRDAAGALLAEE
jgi:hypothetical protein